MSDSEIRRTLSKDNDYEYLRHGLFARALDELYWPRPAKRFCPLSAKEGLYDIAAQDLDANATTYLEFGVHTGWSMSHILRRFRNPGSKFVGFDSFVGLPEKWSNEMERGHFSTGGAMPEFGDPRVQLVKGWFQNTLPGFLLSQPVVGPALVHFDADLYSSTLFLLTTLWHHIPEYHFIFDEFQPDEIIAMYDFTKAYPVEFEFIACTRDQHERPQQIYGRLRNIPLAI